MKNYFVVILLCLVVPYAQCKEFLAESDTTEAREQYEKAQQFRSKRNYDSALYFYEQAAKTYKDFQVWEQFFESKRGAVAMYQSKGLRQQCPELIKNIFETYSEQLDKFPKTVGFLHWDLAAYYYWLRNFPETIRNYTQSIAILDELSFENKTVTLGQLHVARGYAYMHSGQYAKAVQDGSAGEELYLASDSKYNLINAYNLMGITYRRMGEYQFAVDHYRKFLRHMPADIAYYPYKEAMVLYNIGVAYEHAKNYQSAIESFQEGLVAIYDEPDGFSNEKTNIYSSLGKVYTALGQDELAVQYYDSSVTRWINRFGPKSFWVLNGLLPKAEGFVQMGRPKEASLLFEEALSIMKLNKLKDANNLARVYYGLGQAYRKSGDFQRALASLQHGLHVLDPSTDSLDHHSNPRETAHLNHKTRIIEILEEKSHIFKDQFEVSNDTADLFKSFKTIEISLQVIENLQLSLRSEDAKIYFNDKIKRFYELAIACGLAIFEQTSETRYLDFVHKMFESNKSVVLREELEQSKLRTTIGLPDSLLLRETELKSLISTYEKEIHDLRSVDPPETDQVAEVEEILFQTRRQIDGLQQKLRTEYPNYFTRSYLSEIDIAALQRSLRADELIIEYFWGEQVLYMLGISQTNVFAHQTEQLEDLERTLKALREGIISRDFDVYSTAASQVYLEVISPIKDKAEKNMDVKKLTIIPDHLLSYLPFEVLLSKVPTEKRYKDLSYLMKDVSINYNYYTTQTDRDNSSSYTYTFMGFAPTVAKPENEFLSSNTSSREADTLQPLIYSREEVQTIADLLNGTIKVGDDATENAFKQHLQDAQIVHLASHATIDNLDPMYSKLLLFGADDVQEDGALYNYELYNMDIQADLVCLSACNTGYGQIKNGEGVMSLARGFSYAGCPSLITSLWSVSDHSSSTLMALFYQNLEKEMPKDQALRQAKLDYLQAVDENGAAPYFWGGFVHIGSADKVDLNEGSYSYLVLGLLLAILGVGWMYHRNAISVSKDSVDSSHG